MRRGMGLVRFVNHRIKQMKKLVLLVIAILGFLPVSSIAQSYKEWKDHDVVRFYKKVDLDSYSLDKEGEEIEEIYTPTKIDNGQYKVEVTKVSSKLYQIRGTNIYMYFRYSPYLYTYDEGILEVSYNSGTFYEKP